ncbi:hypothetical protein GYMLUDRAFT_938252 [Collybiopsis luxurians FD-317 M1]|uniref:Uncharacterized protein n=1 Tax=Collybiopsis luxurians FD-317 M1 TaxID=944289 RepID=A0A0D0ASG8_9AGAR|nr:hypothetical protein GYMLUDRAFT_938252 [Collybiopsis luxurians FD-317 M1]
MLIPLVPLALTNDESSTTLTPTRERLTFSWQHSLNLSAFPKGVVLEKSAANAATATLVSTLNPSPLQCLQDHSQYSSYHDRRHKWARRSLQRLRSRNSLLVIFLDHLARYLIPPSRSHPPALTPSMTLPSPHSNSDSIPTATPPLPSSPSSASTR